MRRSLRLARALVTVTIALLPLTPAVAQQAKPTIEQFFSPASPLSLASAKKADRLAWMAYEQGKRNVYTAAAPGFRPVKITPFDKDDGIDLGEVSLSDDGTIAVFVRGVGPNNRGWDANPSHDPDGGERAIWVARTDGSGAWRLAAGNQPQISPDGKTV